MSRPYIICHMMTSLDGKITGEYMNTEGAEYVGDKYDKLHDDFKTKVWICGRVTFDDNFTFYEKVDLTPYQNKCIGREDYIAVKNAEKYAVAVDPHGKLAWKNNTIDYNYRVLSHVVEVLTEDVCDAYLAYLQSINVSYIFAGKDKLDLHILVDKLQRLLGANTLLLEGGGVLNGAFLNAGLIDELSLMLAPSADGSTTNNTLFQMQPDLPNVQPTSFNLKSIVRVGNDGLWLTYTVKNKGNIFMNKNILVAYFSASGVTSKTAKTLAETINADLYAITPEKPYTDADLNWNDKNSRSSIEMSDKSSRPAISGKVDNMDDYDTIFVGFPIWWYIAPTIINTFLESYDLTGKTIIPFATSGGSGMGRTNDYLRGSCKGAKLLDGKLLNRQSAQSIKAWVESIK